MSQYSQYTAFSLKVQGWKIRMKPRDSTYLLQTSYILSLHGAHLYALCHQAGYRGHIFVQRCSCFRHGKTGILRLRKATDAPQKRRCCVIGASQEKERLIMARVYNFGAGGMLLSCGRHDRAAGRRRRPKLVNEPPQQIRRHQTLKPHAPTMNIDIQGEASSGRRAAVCHGAAELL